MQSSRLGRIWKAGFQAAALAIVVQFVVTPVSAQSRLAAPVLPDEMFALTSNGCGIIERVPEGYGIANQHAWRTHISRLEWTGDCSNNLANGQGNFGGASAQVAYAQGRSRAGNLAAEVDDRNTRVAPLVQAWIEAGANRINIWRRDQEGLSTQDFASIMQRADSLFDQGNYFGAQLAYSEALAINPLHPDAHNRRGLSHLRQGSYGSADADFQAALSGDPNFASARENLQMSRQLQAQERAQQQQALQQAEEREREDRRQALAIVSAAVSAALPPEQDTAAQRSEPPPPLRPSTPPPLQPSNIPVAHDHNPANDGTNCVVAQPGVWRNTCAWRVAVYTKRPLDGGRWLGGLQTINAGVADVRFSDEVLVRACRVAPDEGADAHSHGGDDIRCEGPGYRGGSTSLGRTP